MTLRRRLGLVAAVAVAIAVALAAAVAYWEVRHQLRAEVDTALRTQGQAIESGDFHSLNQQLPGLSASAGGPAPYMQGVLSGGQTLRRSGGLTLPTGSKAAAVASGNAKPYFADLHVSGVHLREYVVPTSLVAGGEQVAIQLARPLGSVDHVLSHLKLILLLVFAGGIALAAGLGRLAAARVLSPLAEVAHTAERIGETDDLGVRLRIHADDEVGALAGRFNHMLERLQRSRDDLDESVRAQRQLVADASHELRTPVTSLRTNVEVLLAEAQLDPEDRARLLNDVVEQSEELAQLVNDLIELARGDLQPVSAEDVRLDHVVEESLARARRNSSGIEFVSSLEPVSLEGMPERLGRAINNLLDNAARHSPAGGRVEVITDERGVIVRDHGTGIDPADLPYVFDRFYRGASSRGTQGSGLGLAIVRQVAEQHGGTVTADNAPDGGAVVALRLPVHPAGSAGDAATDPGLPGTLEAIPQRPEEDGEHRDDDEQEQPALAWMHQRVEQRTGGDRGDPGEQ
jgi:two-component system, OmpR family, sensor histidine kinase MprB